MTCKLLCLLSAATIAYASARSPSQLVGAQNAEPNEFPYIVSLQFQNKHFCGGSIISEYHILTAAHCVQRFVFLPLANLTVVSGTNSLLKGGQIHAVAGVYPHPQYRGGRGDDWYNDVAVLKLERPIHFNKAQNKIDLPTSEPPVNVQAEVSGWGYDAFLPIHQIYGLQKLFLKIISLEECQKLHEDQIYPNMICTLSGRGFGACSGDSGGPLVYRNQVVGIVSGGYEPCAFGIPDVFTNVYVVLPFIQRAMEQ